jgi:hypothetical protein
MKYKSSGVDGSNGINRRREARVYIYRTLDLRKQRLSPSIHMPKAIVYTIQQTP